MTVPDCVDDRVPDCVDERVPDASLDLLQVELSKHGLYSIGLFRSVPISTKWNWSECHVSAFSRHSCTAVSHQTSKTKVYYSTVHMEEK